MLSSSKSAGHAGQRANRVLKVLFNLVNERIIECYIHIPQHDKKLLRKTSLKAMCHTITQAGQKREI